MLVLVLLAGCSAGVEPGAVGGSPSPSTTTTAAPSPNPTVSPEPEAFVPGPHARLPHRPGPLARRFVKIHEALATSLSEWRTEGDIRERAPKRVILQTLYQQRIVRTMVRNISLGDRTLARLDGKPFRFARDTVIAGRELRQLVTAVPPKTKFKLGRPKPAGVLLDYYRKAKRRFDIDWEILAAINYVETKFNRVRSSSTAGAQGPMQFIPSTWDAYGMGGDIHDPHDAILGAANYLRASGAPDDYRGALFNYNHADEYVRAILRYARVMMRNDRDYLALYSWQVFVITTEGDKRLTGPGL